MARTLFVADAQSSISFSSLLGVSGTCVVSKLCSCGAWRHLFACGAEITAVSRPGEGREDAPEYPSDNCH